MWWKYYRTIVINLVEVFEKKKKAGYKQKTLFAIDVRAKHKQRWWKFMYHCFVYNLPLKTKNLITFETKKWKLDKGVYFLN